MDALPVDQAAVIAIIALSVSVLTLVVAIVLTVRQRALLRRYRLLLSGDAQRDLETLLLQQSSDLEDAQRGLSELSQQVKALTTDARRHAQNIGVVRFSAFPDTGSDLSFAIAILDADANGFVMSSLYGRNESRVYAKPIQAGKSTYALSEEETQAIQRALGTAR